MSQKPGVPWRGDVFVPAGERRVSVVIFSRDPSELEEVRIAGLSDWKIRQTQFDTIFTPPPGGKKPQGTTQ